ncbi:MAG: ImmA/IrrE family metallo-endopeptidase [Verrucomicrobiota bacterium]
MKNAIVLQTRVRQDIQARTDKILRELGNPEPPLSLDDVRALLRLDRDYFTSDSDGLLQAMVSKLKRGGIQILERPMLLFDAVKKFDLRALYLPDRRRIMIDDSIPKPKHRWLEAHEIGHDLLPWHHDMLLGDDRLTPTPSTHDKMEAEANYAAGSLVFLGDRFRDECRQSRASVENAKVLQKRYGNTITTTLWRMIEYAGEQHPIIGAVGQHPGAQDEGPCFRHLIPSMAFDQRFEVPDPHELIVSIRNYCRLNGRGHLGHGEIVMQDRSTRRHVFDFETFYNGYDALTIGVHRNELAVVVAV